MKVKTQKSALPGAWIVNPIDKGRKSIKSNNNIYLENDTSFEIELFNPLTENILADIRLNGNAISKTGLIVKPGQRIYLDCFIDDKKKFIFQTYQVENTNESKQAIKNNGALEVFFYKEQAINIQNWPNRFHQTVIREYYPVYYPTYPHYYPWYGQQYYGSIGTGTYGGAITTSNGNSTLTISGDFDLSSTGTSNYSCNNAFYSDTSISSSNSLGQTINACNNIETGRVEKGEQSGQKFEEIDMEFESNYIHHLVYNLLPISQRPVEASDISQKFCGMCGSKLNKFKSNIKFCPYCGYEII